MNTFYEHPHDGIRFAYRCFDRILINGLVPPFQQPERVVGFGPAQIRATNMWLMPNTFPNVRVVQ